MRFTIAQLDERAKVKPQGYREDVLAVSTRDGDMIDLPQEAYERLSLKWRVPGFVEMLKSATIAAVQYVANPEQRTPEEMTANLTACIKCPFLIERDFRCGKCGCPLTRKVLAKAWHCPEGKW